jgi:prolyl-tRNA synthetase
VKFTTNEGKQEYVWATSWGVSTRMMGALIMSHSDDNGLVLPPNVAPIQVVIVPIHRNDEQLEAISIVANKMIKEFKDLGVSVKYDDRTTHKPGFKFAEYELKGVPIRLAIGPRDLENKTVELARRDTLTKEFAKQDGIALKVRDLLKEIQDNLFQKALSFRDNHTTKVNTFDEFKDILENKAGFISAHWDGTIETENEIKKLTKATIRCIPLHAENEEGKCILTGKPSKQRVIFAKAY